jgi:Na+/H+-translocating membrane pyrophosphatase
MIHIGDLIKAGADAFLQQEYFFCFLWLLVMGGVVLLTVDLYPVFSEESDSEFRMYTTISFLVGGFTSIAGGYICMKIATESNFRTAFQAQTGLNAAF